MVVPDAACQRRNHPNKAHALLQPVSLQTYIDDGILARGADSEYILEIATVYWGVIFIYELGQPNITKKASSSRILRTNCKEGCKYRAAQVLRGLRLCLVCRCTPPSPHISWLQHHHSTVVNILDLVNAQSQPSPANRARVPSARHVALATPVDVVVVLRAPAEAFGAELEPHVRGAALLRAKLVTFLRGKTQVQT